MTSKSHDLQNDPQAVSKTHLRGNSANHEAWRSFCRDHGAGSLPPPIEFPQKNLKIGDQLLKISQEFPEKYSGNILRNFLGKNFGEILRNFLKLSFKTPNLKLGTNSREVLENFRGISHKNLFSRNSPKKFLKASHQNWRTWRNCLLLLPRMFTSMYS